MNFSSHCRPSASPSSPRGLRDVDSSPPARRPSHAPLNRSDTVPMRGFTAAPPPGPERGVGAQVRRRSPTRTRCASTCAILSARPHHLGSPRDSVQRRVDPRAVPRLGARRAHRDLPGALPHAARARGRAGGARRVSRRASASPRVKAGPDVGAAVRAAADLQRLLARRRRHRAAGLRQLRRAGGLRAARAARHLGEGRDRHRASTAARGAASSRRWRPSTARSAASSTPIPRDDGYHVGDTYPDGPVPPARGRAARQRAGHAAVSRRPAHARRRRHRRREAARPRAEAPTLPTIPVQPLSCADAQPLLAAHRRPRRHRAGWAGGAADHVSRGPGPGAGAPQAAVRLAAGAGVRRDRAHSRHASGRTSGWCAATTTTPGSTAPRIRSPGAIAAAGGGARLRRRCSSRAGGRAAPSCWLRGTARSRCCSARPNGRETHADELRAKRASPTSTPTATAAAASARTARPRSARLRQRGGARRDGSGDRDVASGSARTSARSPAARGDDRRGRARARRSPHRRSAGLGLGLHRLLPPPRHPLAQPRLRRRGRRRRSTTRSTTASTGTPPSATPSFVYGRALAQTVGLATMRLADADVLPYEFSRLSERVAANLKEVQDLLRPPRGTRSRSRTASWTRAPSWP